METDTSEIINEMIASVKNFGRVGVTGVYVGFVSPCPPPPLLITNTHRPTTSTSVP
jgi:threonine dehydrogenase-like Zn-dependent dehydrogenase